MRIEHQFSIAGFEVSVSFPDGWDADTLLPSFRPFYGKKEGQEKALLKCTVCTSVENKAAMPSGELIENTLSDMGYVSCIKKQKGIVSHFLQNREEHCMSCKPIDVFLLSACFCTKKINGLGMHCLPCFALPIRRQFFTGMLYPFMLQRCIVRTRLFYLWERAEQEKARILRCG